MKMEALKKQLRGARTKKAKKLKSKMLSTGSTLLNLACTGTADGGFSMGDYIHVVGDSVSGKTFLALTCLAEATLNPKFSGHRLIYDNAERGARMDLQRFFGQKLADQLEPPALDGGGVSVFSETVEDFYFHVDDALEQGKPFIYILDSMDSVASVADLGKFEELKCAHRKGKETTGSYGDGKAKKNSEGLRRVIPKLAQTESILIIISQTRANLKSQFEDKTFSGGYALKFYATLQLWSSTKSKITRTVRGKARQLGIQSKVRIKKNRTTGAERTVLMPVYHSHGIDDIGSCVAYLLEEKHWTKRGQKIEAKEFDLQMTESVLIKTIEQNEWEDRLRDIVGEVWSEIETACTLDRKKRYV